MIVHVIPALDGSAVADGIFWGGEHGNFLNLCSSITCLAYLGEAKDQALPIEKYERVLHVKFVANRFQQSVCGSQGAKVSAREASNEAAVINVDNRALKQHLLTTTHSRIQEWVLPTR